MPSLPKVNNLWPRGLWRGEGRRINKQFTLSFPPGFAYLNSHLIATWCLQSCKHWQPSGRERRAVRRAKGSVEPQPAPWLPGGSDAVRWGPGPRSEGSVAQHVDAALRGEGRTGACPALGKNPLITKMPSAAAARRAALPHPVLLLHYSLPGCGSEEEARRTGFGEV